MSKPRRKGGKGLGKGGIRTHRIVLLDDAQNSSKRIKTAAAAGANAQDDEQKQALQDILGGIPVLELHLNTAEDAQPVRDVKAPTRLSVSGMNVPDDKTPSVLSLLAPTVAAANGKHVVALSISGHVGPEDGPILGKLLSLMPNLVDLSFMLGLDPSLLPTLQQAPPGVRKLSLNYNSLSEKDTNNIIGLLAHFANTEIFSLSGNQWGSASLDGLVNALTQSGSCVRELEFAGMGLTNAASPALGRLLALPKLEVLDIRNNKLTSPSATALADGVRRRTAHLRQLRMCKLKFGVRGTKALVQAAVDSAERCAGTKLELDMSWSGLKDAQRQQVMNIASQCDTSRLEVQL